jgi:putative nucleotidyltransferase with HDIG domain
MANSGRRFLHTLTVNSYLSGHILGGAVLLVWAALHWSCPDPLRFVSYLLCATIGSTLKIRFPGVEGTQSVNFPFLFLAILDLSRGEAVALAVIAILAQIFWQAQSRPRLIQVAFGVANLSIAIWICSLVYSRLHSLVPDPVALAALAVTFFIANTVDVGGIIALTERIPLAGIVKDDIWILPYYAGGVSAAWLVTILPASMHWELPIISLPLAYLVHRSYGANVAKLEQEKKHIEELSALHLRTIEALALAIDAKDHTTHGHLQRVQLYADELGIELGLYPAERDALRAASVLHDIGKLAVPEHIICKPGKLTPAEFEKMKIHPVVGAQILDRVRFPYPVVPIVRSHHEKWDGSGYPDGLEGEKIPIGARILAAVDCLDALASDRQYRRALPVDEAMAKVAAESGKSFDPAVVAVMQRRYRELEQRARELSSDEQPAFTEIRVTRGAAPAAGFATEANSEPFTLSIPAPIGSTSQEPSAGQPPAQLTTEESLAILATRIQSAVPCDAIAFFEQREEKLAPRFADGPQAVALRTLSVPLGEGLVGWVAQSNKPIVNGNPLVEPGFGRGSLAENQLHSALAVPVSKGSGVAGVWALYRQRPDAFSSADLYSLAMHING